jgi:opacity protein-like surface antigen
MDSFKKIALATTLIASNAAMATSTIPTPLFLSAEAGWSNMASGHVSPYTVHYKKNFGYRAGLGYLFEINKSFSLGPEIAYGYYGLISYVNPNNLVAYYESTGWSVLADLKYTAINPVSFYLKAGATELFQHYDISDAPGLTRGGYYQRKVSPTIIAAAAYNLTQHTALSLSYTHIFANSAPLSGKPKFTYTNVNEVVSVDAVMVGVVYSV